MLVFTPKYQTAHYLSWHAFIDRSDIHWNEFHPCIFLSHIELVFQGPKSSLVGKGICDLPCVPRKYSSFRRLELGRWDG